MNKIKTEEEGPAYAGFQVDIIPAKARYVKTGKQLKNIRVAAYCRVSTGDESQQTSYTKQKSFYTELIQKKLGWKLAGIYADEARSGTSREHREQFNRMIEDALKGKMDYIITKSISRFARNTVDTLDCVRQLQRLNPPVGIYFEKENIDTLNSNSEMFLTLYSSIAQEESRSISENIRWSFQKNFRAGKPSVNLRCMLGYDKGQDGSWIVNEEQAEIIRFIFDRFVHGQTGRNIARQLNAKGKKTINGCIWRADAVYYILRNEKYVGDLEMQKTVTESFLTHKSVPNRGQSPKYYVSGHHAPIVDRMTWRKAQALLWGLDPKRAQGENAGFPIHRKRGSQKSLFSIMKCGCCGRPVHRMSYRVTLCPRSEDTKKRFFSDPVWKCTESRSEDCKDIRLRELAMEQSFMELLYRLKRDYEKQGKEAKLVRAFQSVYEEKKQHELPKGHQVRRLELLDMQIGELEERYQQVILGEKGITGWQPEAAEEADRKQGLYTAVNKRGETAENIIGKLEALREEKRKIETAQGEAARLMSHFETFIKLLLGLPEKNRAGQKLCVCGMDEGTPDLLEFDKGIFGAVVTEITTWGDLVHYQTTFGLRLTTDGNSRGPDAFVGFRICPQTGGSYVAKNRYQLYGER